MGRNRLPSLKDGPVCDSDILSNQWWDSQMVTWKHSPEYQEQRRLMETARVEGLADRLVKENDLATTVWLCADERREFLVDLVRRCLQCNLIIDDQKDVLMGFLSDTTSRAEAE